MAMAIVVAAVIPFANRKFTRYSKIADIEIRGFSLRFPASSHYNRSEMGLLPCERAEE